MLPTARPASAAMARPLGSESSRASSFAAACCGAMRKPAACSSTARAAPRRSLQATIGANDRPPLRSQATRLVRWVVIPIAATSDGGAPAAPRVVRISRRTVRQIASASCSTRPGAGVVEATGAAVRARSWPARSNRQTRAVVVPTSMASSSSAIGEEDARVHDARRIERTPSLPQQCDALRRQARSPARRGAPGRCRGGARGCRRGASVASMIRSPRLEIGALPCPPGLGGSTAKVK